MSVNEHTGATLRTNVATDKFRDGWDKIFNQKHTDDNTEEKEVEIAETVQSVP